jgi:hypothetical protein
MNMKHGTIGDSLAWLGGADRDILAAVPQERSRFVQMALVLLTTSSIAMVSMIFAMNDGVKVPLPAAVIAGICWGFVILNLDRYLVLSMGHVRTWRRMLLMAVPRLLLAAVISLVIATPLTLRVFQHDIAVQVTKTQAAESKQMKALEAKSLPAQEAVRVQAKIDSDNAILAGHLPISVSSPQLQDDQAQVNQLQPKVAQAKTAEINAYAAWQCELYGDGAHCANASNRSGNGPIAQAKEAIYQQDLATYNSLNQQLRTAQGKLNTDRQNLSSAQGSQLARYQAAARKDLPVEEKKLATLNAQVQAAQSSAQGAVNNDNGILAQLSALSAAGAANSVLKFAQIIVTLLFFLIEILPVMVKLLLNLAPPTAYDKVAESRVKTITDQADLSRIKARRDAERESDEQRRLMDGESQVRINVADDMRRREEQLGVSANEHVANEMKTILDAQLAEWAMQVRAQLDLPPQGTATPTGNGAFNGHGNGAAHGNGASGNGASPVTGGTSPVHGQPPNQPGPPPDFGLTWDGGLL